MTTEKNLRRLLGATEGVESLLSTLLFPEPREGTPARPRHPARPSISVRRTSFPLPLPAGTTVGAGLDVSGFHVTLLTVVAEKCHKCADGMQGAIFKSSAA